MMTILRASCALVLLSVWISSRVGAGDDEFDTKYGHQNISMGYRRPLDDLLFRENFKAHAKWYDFFIVKSSEVCYLSKETFPRYSINAFNVTDLAPKGKGGYVFVTKGGVASDKLCLHFKSQRGNGFNFHVAVWGYYV